MRKILLVLIFSLFLCSDAFAFSSAVDPADIGVGARPLGMGKAYVALSNDASGVFINPAGLARSKNIRMTSMTATLLGSEGVAYYVLGGAYPTQYGVLGAGYILAGTGNIPLTYLDSNQRIQQYDLASYSASLFLLSFARELNKNLSIGSSLKLFNQGFNATTASGKASLEAGSGSGMDLDFGLQYTPAPWLMLGWSQQNFLTPAWGGKFTWKTGEVEELASITKIGGAIKTIGPKGIYQIGQQELMLGLESEMNLTQKSKPATLHLGLEWWPVTVFALRLGVDQKPRPAPELVDNNFTVGVGLKHAGFTFDYAYHQYGGLPENTTHYFSLGYGGEDIIAEEKPEIPEEKTITVEFSDVKTGYWAESSILSLAGAGLMGGYPDGSFKPEKGITRAELAALLVKVKGIVPPEIEKDLFLDLPRDYWATKYVAKAIELGLMRGYPGGYFEPNKILSRSEGVVVMTIFDQLSLPDVVTRDPFPDVPKESWMSKYVVAAVDAGHLNFLRGKDFEPNQEFIRAEVAEILANTSFVKNLKK